MRRPMFEMYEVVEYLWKDKLQQVCQWCGNRISDDQECAALSLTLAPQFKNTIRGRTSPILKTWLTQAERTVEFVIVSKNSEAEHMGFDAGVLLCGEECSLALKDALQKEINLFSNMN